MPSLIGQSLGRYHILEQLGQGGMASVYKAYDTILERDVAVKVIRVDQFAPAVLDEVLKRFEREAKALAKFSHPNIVHIHDYGEYQGAPYLVMEYLSGGTLKAELGKPMPWQQAKRILLPIAQALAYAHEHNIIHRDIKPSNILLTERGQPMLSDFGIAKILESEQTAALTGTGMGVGTPEYMAPEQWIGQAGPLMDLYSLGVVLYELVTGRKPYTADTPAAIMLKQANDPLPHPRRFAPELPEAVERVLLKALAKRPEDRYQSMGEFAVALERLSDGQPFGTGGIPGGNWRQEEEKTRLERDTGGKAVEETRKVLVPPEPAQKPGKAGRWVVFGGILAGACVLITALGIGLLILWQKGPGPLAGLASATAPATRTLAPTEISTQVKPPAVETPPSTEIPQSTETLPPTETPPPSPGSTLVRPVDGLVMVYVPGGTFSMGQTTDQALADCRNYFNDCQGSWFSDEQPPHSVSLQAYWIDRTEVTNAAYAKCVNAGACQPPASYSSNTRSSYYGNSQYADYPVINVNWAQAGSYCEWAGVRLPTEAEWEKAARGTEGVTYPWGNSLPTCSLANFGEPKNCTGDTSPVESLTSGASVYGALNMAGNVSEWVNDWYSATTYAVSQQSNPTGPNSGQERILRSGAWNLNPNFIRTTNRDHQSPNNQKDYIGFRCVSSAK